MVGEMYGGVVWQFEVFVERLVVDLVFYVEVYGYWVGFGFQDLVVQVDIECLVVDFVG